MTFLIFFNILLSIYTVNILLFLLNNNNTSTINVRLLETFLLTNYTTKNKMKD